tara:strand:+ start:285 stop:533 length:249 start_codon:yes stop_codon:yes gene_type:complete
MVAIGLVKPMLIYMNNIGIKIKEARLSNEFSREQVARKLGVSQQQLSRYESGENRISADKLAVLATVLHKPIDYFHESGLPI